MAERRAVDVGEDHGAAKLELLHGAAQLSDRGSGIAERKRGERGEAAAFRGDDAGEGVIDQARQAVGGRRLLQYACPAW